MGKPRVIQRPSRRRIAVVTGSRAEYGLLRSTISAIQEHKRLELQLIVTGMHLLPKFGRTVKEIRADGFPIAAEIRMQRGHDSPTDQAEGLSRGIAGIARFLNHARADVVLVLGDRIEAMAGALAAVTTGRKLAHIHGGDVAPGDMDDALRDAISQMADLHFPATKQSARRLAAMGIPPGRIHMFGPPGMDEICSTTVRRTPNRAKGHPFALVVQHPCGRSDSSERRTMLWILDSIRAEKLAAHIIYPNTDRGHSGILQAIQSAQSRNGMTIRVNPSLPRRDYLDLVQQSRVMIGNSSSGLLEAGNLGTIAVNVGDRQAGRERYGGMVVDAVDSRAAIRRAVAQALSARPGDKHTARRAFHRTGWKIARQLAVAAFVDD